MTKIGIMTTRYWYDSPHTRDIVCDGIGRPLAFDRREDAVAWIDDADQTVYETAHNEAGRPEYTAVNVSGKWYQTALAAANGE